MTQELVTNIEVKIPRTSCQGLPWESFPRKEIMNAESKDKSSIGAHPHDLVVSTLPIARAQSEGDQVTTPNWEVVVGKIGTVFSGSEELARVAYDSYVEYSQADSGRASGEPVTLTCGDFIEAEYQPPSNFRCDQCQAAMINGVFCHEHGCPNARKTWLPDREQWVLFGECRECRSDVETSESCDCHEVDWDPSGEPEEIEEEIG